MVKSVVGFVMICVSVVLFIMAIISYIFSGYEWKRDCLSYWNLADKASTIEQKAAYINKFYSVMTTVKLTSHDAIWLKTEDNSAARNLEALKSLRDRLEQIKTMNPSSFEYQQAIAQITAQEQGEAQSMINVLKGCWVLQRRWWCWSWLSALVFGGLILGVIFGGVLLSWDDD